MRFTLEAKFRDDSLMHLTHIRHTKKDFVGKYE